MTRCPFCGRLISHGEACSLCLPLVDLPRPHPAGEQLLAERYDLTNLSREAFPQGAAP